MAPPVFRLASASLLIASTLAAVTPQVWFCPMDPLLRPEVAYGGSPEYMSLFSANAPWSRAASHVDVFKIYPQWISAATDADLQIQFADLNRRGIALALEFGVLTPEAVCGRSVEGFGGNILAAAQRIQRNGGKLRYLAMDEPIYFSTLYTGTNACRWSVDQMADNAAANLRALWAQFPDVQVGDIEPFPIADPKWLSQYEAGVAAFRRALGRPLAFFHADIPWGNTTYLAALRSVRDMTSAAGVPFGIIYNGNRSDESDAGWIQAASRNLLSVESNVGTPDQVIFQSWHPYPRKLLPEPDPDAFTWLIDSYFRRRTSLSVSVTSGAVRGQLVAAGAPVAAAPIQLTATATRGAGSPARYTLSGAIPAGTQRVVLGVRVNLECGCSGTADFLLSKMLLDTSEGTLARDFTAGMNGWGSTAAGAASAKIENGSLHVASGPTGTLLLNSAPIPLTASGSFTLRVDAQVAPLSVGSGYFTAIFLGASSEISRVRVPLAPPGVPLGAPRTDAAGRFVLPLPAGIDAAFRIDAAYAGDNDNWPAESTAVWTTRPRR